MRENKPVRLIELFAGYGSQAMALKRLDVDFENYRVIECDKFAIRSYNAIHGTSFSPTDIRNITSSDLGIYDIEHYCYMITYSFPCTDLSVAGTHKGMTEGSGTNSSLLWEVKRLLQEIVTKDEELPQILFMENVTQVHGTKYIDQFNVWISFLENIGYTNFWKDLNASDFGIPQNRNRCYMMSFLHYEGTFKFPESVPLTTIGIDYLEDHVADKYYVKNEKAEKMLQILFDTGQLPFERERECADGSIRKTKLKDRTINTITSRENRGVSNIPALGNMVIDLRKTGSEKRHY